MSDERRERESGRERQQPTAPGRARVAGGRPPSRLRSFLSRRADLPVFAVWLLGIAVVVLLVMLWSAQRGRHHVALHFANVDNLQETLPSIVGATHAALVPGNAITILENGDPFFGSLLADIAAARSTIHIESYVWWKGDICRRVAEALVAKRREGVEVRLLLDASGSSRMDDDIEELLEKGGVSLARYRPFRLSNLGRLNGRDHRKVAVIDGHVAYVFGHGFAQEWTGNAQDREHWRDTGARVTGPIVGVLQSAFTENWVETTGEVLVGLKYFPRLKPTGTIPMHAAYLFQHGSVSSVELLHRIAFSAARRQLWIQNPYMAADPPVIEDLVKAVQRGVDVRITVPGPVTDSEFVRHAGHHLFERLLRGGVKVYEYQRTLNHQKVMVVDGFWSLVGSTNLDDRSFESNEELSVGIVDPGVAGYLSGKFEEDLRSARQVRLQEWEDRGWWHKVKDDFCYLFNELL